MQWLQARARLRRRRIRTTRPGGGDGSGDDDGDSDDADETATATARVAAAAAACGRRGSGEAGEEATGTAERRVEDGERMTRLATTPAAFAEKTQQAGTRGARQAARRMTRPQSRAIPEKTSRRGTRGGASSGDAR